MRPRYLEIEGLQSFQETQKIDFDSLSETGLFGIFGPTGSGKSTVLDAITLALYGKVHRVNGTQGIVNTNLNGLKVSFTFDILKENTRKTFRVERIYNRKKGSENSCEVKIARLIEVLDSGEIPIVDKHGEVSSKVEELLGLKLDDFTRAVVLPQNKFQEFLLMNNSDKSKMLERIFYLEEYGKLLNEKVTKKLTASLFSLREVNGALTQLQDASDIAINEAKKSMEIEEASSNNSINELKVIEKKFAESKEIWALEGEKEAAAKKEQLHLKGLNEINQKKLQYENALKADGIADLIKRNKESEKLSIDTLLQLESVLIEFSGLKEGLENARKSYEIAAKESEVETPRLVEKKLKLNNALEIQKETDLINVNLSDLREKFIENKERIKQVDMKIKASEISVKAIEEKITSNKSKLMSLKVDSDYKNEIQRGVKLEDEFRSAKSSKITLEDEFNRISADVKVLQEAFDAISDKVRKGKTLLDNLSLEKAELEKSRPISKDELNASILRYHDIKTIASTLKKSNDVLSQVKFKAENVNETLERLCSKLLEAKSSRNNFEAEKMLCLKEIEGYKRIIGKNNAYILAKDIKEGEACPVCGSTSHPVLAVLPDHENAYELDEKLASEEARLNLIETKFRSEENNCISLGEQIKNLRIQTTQLSEEFEERNKEHKKITSCLPEKFQNLNQEQLDKEIVEMYLNNENNSKLISEWEISHQNLSNNVLKENERLAGLLVEEEGIRSRKHVNVENLQKAENMLKSATEKFTELSKVLNEFLDKYKIESSEKEFKRISENDKSIEELQREIEKQQNKIDEERKIIDSLQTEMQGYLSIQTIFETDGKNLRAQKEEKEKKITELSNGGDILTEIKAVENRLSNLAQQEKALEESVKNIEESFNSIATQKYSLENQLELHSRNLESSKKSLDEAIYERGFTNAQDAENSIISKDRQKLIKEEIEDYNQILNNIKAQRDIISEKLGNRSITEDDWNKIDSEFQTKLLEKEESIAKYHAAKSKYFNTKERHENWKLLSERADKLSSKVQMLEQIKSLLRGNSFIEYVAEERLRYIVKAASEHLGIMTKYRYVLELNWDNGFVICDNANGGAKRNVNSLSGGETFLTSLSLALALSKQIQLKGQSPLEFFFLDEGFGTLDSSLLDTVIDSLERLSSRERVIGLISHVPELRNRISRRLMIEPPTSSGNGSRIRIEKA